MLRSYRSDCIIQLNYLKDMSRSYIFIFYIHDTENSNDNTELIRADINAFNESELVKVYA